MDSDRIAHLGFIQNVISRMAGNSLALKGTSVALTTAVIAIMAALSEFNSVFFLAGIVPIILCWILDAKYLRLERQYREMYNSVRLSQSEVTFSMNPHDFIGDVASTARIALTWSVMWFYIALVVMLFGSAYIVLC